MTEAEWLECADPEQLLIFLVGKISERKRRLFACACCRQVWHELRDERSRQAVIVAERHADGLATAKELKRASDAAALAWDSDRKRWSRRRREWYALEHPLCSAAAYNVALPIGWWGGAPAFVDPCLIVLEASHDRDVQGVALCVLLRDVVGNPFRPVLLDHAWLTAAVKGLAQSICEESRFQDMPILADALEEVGCTNADLLSHCRGPGPHVRGCWALDLILGKE